MLKNVYSIWIFLRILNLYMYSYHQMKKISPSLLSLCSPLLLGLQLHIILSCLISYLYTLFIFPVFYFLCALFSCSLRKFFSAAFNLLLFSSNVTFISDIVFFISSPLVFLCMVCFSSHDSVCLNLFEHMDMHTYSNCLKDFFCYFHHLCYF